MRARVVYHILHRALQMLIDTRFAAVLERQLFLQERGVARFLYKLAACKDQPHMRVRVEIWVKRRAKAKNSVAILILVAQAFADRPLRLLRRKIQLRHCDLRIIAHGLFSERTEINLLLRPVIEDGIDAHIWRLRVQRVIFLPHCALRRFQL